MEKVLDAEIELAHFRATLEGLINEVAERRVIPEPGTAWTPSSPASSSRLASQYHTPEHDDDEALARRLERARELEEKAVLEKRAEALREDASQQAADAKRLKRYASSDLQTYHSADFDWNDLRIFELIGTAKN